MWHGWTTPENAPVYEKLLNDEIFPSIEQEAGTTLKTITLLRQDKNEETEFIVMMRFTNLEAVKTFAGEDYRQAWIPENARKILLRYDHFAEHFDVRRELVY